MRVLIILFIIVTVEYSVNGWNWNGNLNIYRRKRNADGEGGGGFEWKPSKTPTFITKMENKKNVPTLTIYPPDRQLRSGRSRGEVVAAIEKSQPQQRTGARRIIYYATLPEIVRYPQTHTNDRFMYQLPPTRYNERSYDLPSGNDFVTKVQSSIIDVKSNNKNEGMPPTFTIVEADPKPQLQRYSTTGSIQRPYDQRLTSYDLYYQSPVNSFYKPAPYYQSPYPTRHDRFPSRTSNIVQQDYTRPLTNVRQNYKRPAQVIQSFITPIDNVDVGPSNFQSDGNDFDLSHNFDSGYNSITDSFHDSFNKDPLQDQFKYFDYNNFLSTTSPLSQKYMDLNTFQSVTSLKKLKPETTTSHTFITADLSSKPVVETNVDDDYSPGGYGLKLQANLFPKLANSTNTSDSNSTEINNNPNSMEKSNYH